MINKYKSFILKILLPTLIIYFYFRYNSYKNLGYFYPFYYFDILMIMLLLFLTSLFWGLLGEFQNLTGDFLKSNLTTKIIFIIAILGIFYLYKITGKI